MRKISPSPAAFPRFRTPGSALLILAETHSCFKSGKVLGSERIIPPSSKQYVIPDAKTYNELGNYLDYLYASGAITEAEFLQLSAKYSKYNGKTNSSSTSTNNSTSNYNTSTATKQIASGLVSGVVSSLLRK